MVAEISFLPSAPLTARAAAARVAAAHDVILVRRFNGGDESAFVEIVARYRAKLFGIALGLLRNRADAEEIAQDAPIRAHRSLVRFRGDSSLSAWLHRITLNLARNRYWYHYRRRRHLNLSLDAPLREDTSATFTDLVATDAADPVREAATREFSAHIAGCMAQLGAPAREILLLRNSRNHTYVEISRELGINVGTVKSRVARARASLRVLLAKACPEFRVDVPLRDWFETARPAGLLAVSCA